MVKGAIVGRVEVDQADRLALKLAEAALDVGEKLGAKSVDENRGESHNKQFGADARTVFENVVRQAFYTISKVRCFQIPSSRLAFRLRSPQGSRPAIPEQRPGDPMDRLQPCQTDSLFR